MKTLKIFFYQKKDKLNQSGKSAIYGKITYLDSKTTFATGVYMTTADWAKTKQLSKPKTEEEEKSRRELNQINEKIVSFEERLRIQNEPISAAILKAMLLQKEAVGSQFKNSNGRALLQLYSEYIKEKEQLLEAGRRSGGTLTLKRKHLGNY